MTCPDIDGNAGAHVHTRSKTPCEGLHWVNTVWSKGAESQSEREAERDGKKQKFKGQFPHPVLCINTVLNQQSGLKNSKNKYSARPLDTLKRMNDIG